MIILPNVVYMVIFQKLQQVALNARIYLLEKERKIYKEKKTTQYGRIN